MKLTNRKTQCMSARQCAALHKRMRALATSETYLCVYQDTLAAGKRRGPGVTVSWTDSEGDGGTFSILALSHHAAKLARKYLFAQLPSWPDIDGMPAVNGLLVKDDDWSWFSMAPTGDGVVGFAEALS
jgi:hypothetical protein